MLGCVRSRRSSCAKPFAAEEVMRLPGPLALSPSGGGQVKPPHASVVFITAPARKAAVTRLRPTYAQIMLCRSCLCLLFFR
ncbi:hypothetical protein PC123_g6354 [Phytophthora cactorum]|nr:hypothetical protein PC123_g6354 [Phytophthora cactorum]